jgi:hypothetical protein
MCQHYSHCLPPVSTTPVVQVAKFAASVVDTGCKFAPGVIDVGVFDAGGAPSLAPQIFGKIRNAPNVIFWGFWEDDS